MPNKKAIIIGSGIAGSGIAALLAHSGKYDVDLFEKNKLIGGRFATHFKEDFRLDIGCHMIANSDKGTIGEILNIVGQPEAVKWKYSDNNIFNYKGTMLEFPAEMHKMGFSEDDIQRVMQFYLDLNSIPEDQYEEYDKISLVDQLGKYIENDLARTFFGFMSGLCFVVTDSQVPVGEYARCSQEMIRNQSTGYPIGGTSVVPEAYVNIMEQYGGRMHASSPIERIIVEDKVAKGVMFKDGTVLDCDMVISNAGLKPTVNSLVGREHYSDEFLNKVDAYEYSRGSFQVKVALDEPIIKDETMVLYIGGDVLDLEKVPGDEPLNIQHMMIPIISNCDPSACPEGKQLIISGGHAQFPFDTAPENWEKMEKAYVDALEIPFPGISKHIMWTTHSSPGDIDRLFGKEGNVIGIGQTLTQIGKNRPPIVDPEIKNLYHCSADSGMHGIGGELAADSALRLYKMLV